MKRWLTLIPSLWLLFCCAATAQIAFRQLDWEAAKALAHEQKKTIFVDVYTSWCGPCRKMNREVFTDQKVATWFNEHFVCLQLDAEREKQHGFFQQYAAQSFPTFFWLDADGRLQWRHEGFLTAEAFLQTAKDAQRENVAATVERYREEWERGCRDSAFVSEYLFKVLPQANAKDVRPLLNEYLAALPDAQKRSLHTCNMVSSFSRTIVDDEVFRTLARYNEDYRRAKHSAEFNKLLYTIFVRVPMADRQLRGSCDDDLAIINKVDFPNRQVYADCLAAEQHLFDGNYAEGLSRAIALIAKYHDDYPELAAELSYTLIISNFFLEPRPEGETSAALQLAETALQTTPSKATLSYAAACHALAGQYKQAYELLMHTPFYPEPALSNAVFPKLNLSKQQTFTIH